MFRTVYDRNDAVEKGTWEVGEILIRLIKSPVAHKIPSEARDRLLLY